MTVLITLTAGADTGPFLLYSDIDGFTSAFEVGISKIDLEAGYTSTLVPDGTTVIRVMSQGVCTNYVDISVTTTTTTTTVPLVPTQRCTAINTGSGGSDAGYRMEGKWNDDQSPNPPDGIYSFEIIECKLDGVQYGVGEILTITAPNDLVVGPGIYGGTYVQNINDWLNSISGISAAGFAFHDDMSTIDTPTPTSTYDIVFKRTVVRTGSIFYYRYQKLSSGTTGWGFGWPVSTMCYGGCWPCSSILS